MAITPGLQLPYGIQPTNPIPVDSLSGPFTGGSTAAAVAAANAAISPALRFQSMEVRIIVGGVSYKYWYYDGTGDANLVEMQTSPISLASDTQIIYNSSGNLTGSGNMVYTGLTFGLTADMKIVGNLIVTGRIITSTGIQGDPDADVETIENMLMDGGEFS